MNTQQSELDRAWRYHDAADQLLNGRIQSFLIAQAFLVVGYAQIITSGEFSTRPSLSIALLAVAMLAVYLTILMRSLAAELSRGLRSLKETYLLNETTGDDVYLRYFSALRGDGYGPSILGHEPRFTKHLPTSFLVFWVFASLFALWLVIANVS